MDSLTTASMTAPLRTQTRRLAAITSHLVPPPSDSLPNRGSTSSPARESGAGLTVQAAARVGGAGNERPATSGDIAQRRKISSAAANGRGEGGGKPAREPSTWTDERRYGYWLPIQTRWQDNDQYGHMNNAIYYHLFDTIANSFLISHCSLDPSSPTSPIGLIVSSSCTYLAPLTFPAPVLAALTVGKLGRSSVEWRIALWPARALTAQDDGSSRYGTPGVVARGGEVGSSHRIAGPCAAYGTFTHVFVDPSTRKSVELPPRTRKGLELLLAR